MGTVKHYHHNGVPWHYGHPAPHSLADEWLEHPTEINKAFYGDDNPRPSKAETLDKAKEAVADRGLNYGSPEDNFKRIALLWSAHLENRYNTTQMEGFDPPVLDAHDVAMMMALMKIARLENDPRHGDSWIDMAGYAACGNNLP